MAGAGQWLANAGQWLGSGLAAEVPGAHLALCGTLGTEIGAHPAPSNTLGTEIGAHPALSNTLGTEIGAHLPLSNTLGTWAGAFLAEKGYQPRCLDKSTDHDDTEIGVLPLVQKKRHQPRCLARPADYDDTESGVTVPRIKNKTPVKTAFPDVSSCSPIRLHSGKQPILAESRIHLPF